MVFVYIRTDPTEIYILASFYSSFMQRETRDSALEGR